MRLRDKIRKPTAQGTRVEVAIIVGVFLLIVLLKAH